MPGMELREREERAGDSDQQFLYPPQADLMAAVDTIIADHGQHRIDPRRLLAVFDRHENALESERPHRSFREVAGTPLQRALDSFPR